MKRVLRFGFAWALVTGVVGNTGVSSQVILGPDGPVNPESPRTTEKPTVYRLSVDPAAEPEPALRYVLQPEYLKQKPGNAVPYYYRALFLYRQTSPETRKLIDQWAAKPAHEQSKAKVEQALQQCHSVFSSLRTAAFREDCDWEWRIRDLDGMDQISFLLPEINELRSLARLLSLKASQQIDAGQYEDAVQTLAIGYKLARDVAEPPTLVNDLVGIAIAATMNDRLRELIDAPGSPNLYWALADLPRPLIDMRPALRHEMSLPMMIWPFLQDAETTHRSKEAWRDLMVDAVKRLRRLDGATFASVPDSMAEAAALVLVSLGYPRAKRGLVKAGFDPEEVEKMPVGQVVAIYQARTYAHIYQEMFKFMLLPYDQGWEHQKQAEEKLRKEGYLSRFGPSSEVIPMASLLLPAVSAARRAEVRLTARMAALQAVEAVRMHVAKSDGRLPASLGEIDLVPVPNNPFTGKPFPYRLDGDIAILEIPAHAGLRAEEAWRLEVRVSGP